MDSFNSFFPQVTDLPPHFAYGMQILVNKKKMNLRGIKHFFCIKKNSLRHKHFLLMTIIEINCGLWLFSKWKQQMSTHTRNY